MPLELTNALVTFMNFVNKVLNLIWVILQGNLFVKILVYSKESNEYTT